MEFPAPACSAQAASVNVIVADNQFWLADFARPRGMSAGALQSSRRKTVDGLIAWPRWIGLPAGRCCKRVEEREEPGTAVPAHRAAPWYRQPNAAAGGSVGVDEPARWSFRWRRRRFFNEIAVRRSQVAGLTAQCHYQVNSAWPPHVYS